MSRSTSIHVAMTRNMWTWIRNLARYDDDDDGGSGSTFQSAEDDDEVTGLSGRLDLLPVSGCRITINSLI